MKKKTTKATLSPKSFSVERYCKFAMHIDWRRDPHPLTFILIKKDVITLKSKIKTSSKNVSLIIKKKPRHQASPIFCSI